MEHLSKNIKVVYAMVFFIFGFVAIYLIYLRGKRK